MPRPLPASGYWVEPARFAAGAYPAPGDLAVLIAAGIGGFIDLTPASGFGGYAEEAARLAREAGQEALHNRLPITDFGVPEIDAMHAILDAIDAWIAARRAGRCPRRTHGAAPRYARRRTRFARNARAADVRRGLGRLASSARRRMDSAAGLPI